MQCVLCSRGYEVELAEEDSIANTDGEIEALQPLQKRNIGASTAMKKPVELDGQGQPFGAMKAVLSSDVKKYAKDLDPTTGWEGQPRQHRRRLFRCLYTSTHFIP